MRHEELEIGMKVKVKSKSIWEEDIKKYLFNDYGVGKFIRENGYGYIVSIGQPKDEDFEYSESKVIVVGTKENLKDGDGDYFIAEDLEPYIELNLTHVTMAEEAFYQFKTLTHALDRDDLINEFGNVSDATSNYIIEKLGLTRADFITTTVDNSLIEECTFDCLLEKLGVDVE